MHADRPVTGRPPGGAEDRALGGGDVARPRAAALGNEEAAALPDVPPEHVEAADLVLRHLVAVRGGTPFLSPNDACLLVRWLDQGVPVRHILAGVEAAADRRRRQRARLPVSLEHAKAAVDKAVRQAPLAAAPAAVSKGAGQRVADAITAADSPLAPQLATLAALLRAVPDGPEAAERLLGAISGWLDATWHKLGPEGRAPWTSRAAAELADLAEVLDEGRFEALVEEHGRGLLRADLPPLSAAAVIACAEAAAWEGA